MTSQEGVEGLAKHLNSYFGQMVRIIASEGGDVFKVITENGDIEGQSDPVCIFISSTTVSHSSANRFRSVPNRHGRQMILMDTCVVITFSRLWINRIRLPILLVVG